MDLEKLNNDYLRLKVATEKFKTILEQYENDEYWGKIIKDSKVFKGVVESISESPCSMLLYDKNVSEEIGLIKTKEGICCNLDGYNCDVYKYLKND